MGGSPDWYAGALHRRIGSGAQPHRCGGYGRHEYKRAVKEPCLCHHVIQLVYNGMRLLPQGRLAVRMTALAGKVNPPRLMDWLLTVQARIPRRLEQKQPPFPSLISQILQRGILAHNAPTYNLTDPPRASTCRIT